MALTIRLFANFRDGRFKEAPREYTPGTVVGDIVDALGIARKEVGVLMVNGRHATFEQAPKDGDAVAIFPLVGGG
jgi:molybdopterin converting factor small subunit